MEKLKMFFFQNHFHTRFLMSQSDKRFRKTSLLAGVYVVAYILSPAYTEYGEKIYQKGD